MNKLLTDEGLRQLAGSLSFASLLPPVKRVRRRGFRRDVRQGDDVRLADGTQWTVVRRSAWHLWLEPLSRRFGDVIRIKLPARFQVSAA